MKRTALVVVLALVLTFAFATSALATTGKFFAGGVDYYKWLRTTGDPSPATAFINDGLSTIGANPANPGAHAGYLANTAKCGICHSVHRAAANPTDHVALLKSVDPSCAGCHTTGTTVTTKLVTWTAASTTWIPSVDPSSSLAPLGSPAWLAASGSAKLAAITNKPAAGGAANGGGPHNDSLVDMVGDGFWDGTGTPPLPAYEGYRYGCFTRRCHAANPHGAGSPKYTIFAQKLLFNAPAADDEPIGPGGSTVGTYGGLDAVYDELGATDAAVQRFIDNNEEFVRESPTTPGLLEVNKEETGWRAPDVNETHALVAGLTCGRPSNVHTGEDECHAEASYAIIDKGIKENRNKGTGLAGTAYRTDNTQAETPGYGGNDSRTSKTGHVAGTFAAIPGEASYAPIAGCTSCHDQTDSANSVAGNFTFPHGQSPTGNTNLYLSNGTMATTGGDVTKNTAVRSRIWAGWSGSVGATLTVTGSSPAGQKAFDGQCLKCHRAAGGTAGVGLSK